MSEKPRPHLTLFFDSYCPLCVKEMHLLKAKDEHQRLAFEDIHQPEFSLRFPHVDPASANAVLHGQLANGQMIYGLDVTAHAWALVGNRLFQLLRLPLIRPVADIAYRLFARHRYRISFWVTGQARCENCNLSTRVCEKN